MLFWWVFIVFGFFLWIGNIFMTAWLAGEKNRPKFEWGLLAFLFGILATIVIAGAPALPRTEDVEKPDDKVML